MIYLFVFWGLFLLYYLRLNVIINAQYSLIVNIEYYTTFLFIPYTYINDNMVFSNKIKPESTKMYFYLKQMYISTML